MDGEEGAEITCEWWPTCYQRWDSNHSGLASCALQHPNKPPWGASLVKKEAQLYDRKKTPFFPSLIRGYWKTFSGESFAFTSNVDDCGGRGSERERERERGRGWGQVVLGRGDTNLLWGGGERNGSGRMKRRAVLMETARWRSEGEQVGGRVEVQRWSLAFPSWWRHDENTRQSSHPSGPIGFVTGLNQRHHQMGRFTTASRKILIRYGTHWSIFFENAVKFHG